MNARPVKLSKHRVRMSRPRLHRRLPGLPMTSDDPWEWKATQTLPWRRRAANRRRNRAARRTRAAQRKAA